MEMNVWAVQDRDSSKSDVNWVCGWVDFFLKYLFIYLFIYLWLCWVFVSVQGLSLVEIGRAHV